MKTVTKEGCHFAVKGGGHARDVGFSNADAGVTIDLVRMGTVELSQDKKTVKVGAGARWADVFSTLEKDNLTVVGGRVSDVGVAGLTLGGGISFFSARHGLACDSVLSYSLVLPDTTVLPAVTAKSHPDLFFALRGAGHANFGIVTSFTFTTIPLPNPAGLWDGIKMYSFDKAPAIISAWHTVYTVSLPNDLDIGGFNVFGYVQPYDAWFVVDRYVHTSHPTNTTWPAIWAPFDAVEGVPDTTRVAIRPYSDITIEIGAQSPHGMRNIYATFSHRPSIDFATKLLELYEEHVTPIKNVEGILPALVMQPLSTNAISLMSRNGGNALGLTLADGPLVITSIAWMWKNAADDAVMYAAYRKFLPEAEDLAKEMGVWHRFKYANYAEASQDVWSGYGEENLKRLKKVQRRVDPDGVFVKGGLAGVGFKLNEKVVDAAAGESGAAKGKGTSRKSEL